MANEFNPDSLTEKIHCVVDLETMGILPGSKLLSIGAVGFHCTNFGFGLSGVTDTLNFNYDIANCPGQEDPETVAWWKTQGPASWEWVQELSSGYRGRPIEEAIASFYDFVEKLKIEAATAGRKVQFWSRGNFDFPHLECWFRRFDFPIPWQYWEVADIRSLMLAFPEFKRINSSIPHNALADAIADSRNLIGCFSLMAARTGKEVK